MILFSQDIFNTRQYFSWSTPFSLDCNKRFSLFFQFFKKRIMFLHLGSIVGVCQRLLRGSFTPLCLECEPQPNPSSLLFLFIGDESNQCLVTYWWLRYWSFGDLIGWLASEVGNRESVDNSLGQLRGWQQDFHGGFELLSHSLLWLFMLLLLILFNPGGGTMRPPHGF